MDARLVDDDGAFWMSFEDFLSNFFSINVCMVSQPMTSTDDGKTRVPWVESRERFTYKLVDGAEGKEVHVPSYGLTLAEEAKHVYVSVHQKDTRCVGAGPYIDIGVTVMKVTPETKSGFTLIASTGSSCDRQNQTESLCLSAGKYVIMPTSTGCKLKNVSNLIVISPVTVITVVNVIVTVDVIVIVIVIVITIANYHSHFHRDCYYHYHHHQYLLYSPQPHTPHTVHSLHQGWDNSGALQHPTHPRESAFQPRCHGGCDRAAHHGVWHVQRTRTR
jgi:hypothetical protein